jgi:hypothetical protein
MGVLLKSRFDGLVRLQYSSSSGPRQYHLGADASRLSEPIGSAEAPAGQRISVQRRGRLRNALVFGADGG